MAAPMNRDESLRALSLARQALAEGDLDRAQRLTDKSIRLSPSPEAVQLAADIGAARARAGDAPPSAQASGQGADGQAPPTSSHAGSHAHKPSEPRKEDAPESSAKGQSRLRSMFGAFGGKKAAADEQKQAATAEQLEAVAVALRAQTHYELLGVAQTATQAEIKRRYFALALRLHPDKNPAAGADNAFKLLSEAYACLKDDKERAAYDSDLRSGRNAKTGEWRHSHSDAHDSNCTCGRAHGPVKKWHYPVVLIYLLFTVIYFIVDCLIEIPFKPALYYSKARILYLRLRGRHPYEMWADGKGRLWLREEDGVVTDITEIMQLAAELEMRGRISGRRVSRDPMDLFVQAVANTMLFDPDGTGRGFQGDSDDEVEFRSAQPPFFHGPTSSAPPSGGRKKPHPQRGRKKNF